VGTGVFPSKFYESRCLCGFVNVKFELGYAERLPHAKASVDYLHPDVPFAPALYRIQEIRQIGAVSELALRKERFIPRDRVDVETIGAFRVGGLVVLCLECRKKAMEQASSNINGAIVIRVVVAEENNRMSVKFAA
jgi:hypothetical protein